MKNKKESGLASGVAALTISSLTEHAPFKTRFSVQDQMNLVVGEVAPLFVDVFKHRAIADLGGLLHGVLAPKA
jgi:hypothetical protein